MCVYVEGELAFEERVHDVYMCKYLKPTAPHNVVILNHNTCYLLEHYTSTS